MTSRFRGARAPRRQRQWAQTRVNATISAATHAAIVNIDLLTGLETALGLNLTAITVSAINLRIDFRLTSSTTGDDNTITTAIAVVGQDAFDDGGVVLPDPSNDHYDWMFWDDRTLMASRDVTAIDEWVPGGSLTINNKSMRKMRSQH